MYMSVGMYRNELDLDPHNEKKYNANKEWFHSYPLFNHRIRSHSYI